MGVNPSLTKNEGFFKGKTIDGVNSLRIWARSTDLGWAEALSRFGPVLSLVMGLIDLFSTTSIGISLGLSICSSFLLDNYDAPITIQLLIIF